MKLQIEKSSYKHLHGHKEISYEICRICENNSYNIQQQFIKFKSKIFKKNIFPIISKLPFEKNIGLLDIPNDENNIIFPCECMLPVHIKCLLGLIIISQNLKCDNCKSFYYIIKSGKKSFLSKLSNKKYIPYFFTQLIIIGLSIYCIYYINVIQFDEKYFHIYIIILVFFVLIMIITILTILNLTVYLYKIPLNETIIFSSVNFNQKDNYISLNSKTHDISNINNSWKKSVEIYLSYLYTNFDIEIGDIIEYISDKNLKSSIRNKINFNLEVIFNEYKNFLEPNRNLSSNDDIYKNTLNSALSKNPKLSLILLEDEYKKEKDFKKSLFNRDESIDVNIQNNNLNIIDELDSVQYNIENDFLSPVRKILKKKSTFKKLSYTSEEIIYDFQDNNTDDKFIKLNSNKSQNISRNFRDNLGNLSPITSYNRSAEIYDFNSQSIFFSNFIKKSSKKNNTLINKTKKKLSTSNVNNYNDRNTKIQERLPKGILCAVSELDSSQD